MNYDSIREYAKKYLELAHSPEQEAKRKAWKDLNSFRFSRPLIYIMEIPYHEFMDLSIIKSEDPVLRMIEKKLATTILYRQTVKDDFIYEPWVTVRAKHTPDTRDHWGVPCTLGERTMNFGAAAFKPSIMNEEDIEKIKPVKYAIDEKATAETADKVREALGGILDVVVDRRGVFCTTWSHDICTDLAKMRGLEQMMMDTIDRPEWFHRISTLMRDTILADIDATEKAGNYRSYNHESQSMCYCDELAPPNAGSRACKTSELWDFMASQEFTGIGPEHFNEFLLEYQKPIMERFGLSAYGCCEDLTAKIHLLKKIKNLRRISITPFSDVRKCAEQIGNGYITSYRPVPTDMIANGLDEDRVRKIVKRDYQIMKENKCIFEMNLKDVRTISGKPNDLIRWVELVRKIGDEVLG